MPADDEQTGDGVPCDCCGDDTGCCLCDDGACWQVTSGGATDEAVPTLPGWFDMITGQPTGFFPLVPESAVGEAYDCSQVGQIQRCGSATVDGKTVCWDELLIVSTVCTTDGVEVWVNRPPVRTQHNNLTTDCIQIVSDFPSASGDQFYQDNWDFVGLVSGGCPAEDSWSGAVTIPVEFDVLDIDGSTVLGTISYGVAIAIGWSGTLGTCISSSDGVNTIGVNGVNNLDPLFGIPVCPNTACSGCFNSGDDIIIVNPPPGPGMRPPVQICAGSIIPPMLNGNITATGTCGCLGTNITFVWIPYSATEGAYVATLIACGSFVTLKMECISMQWFQEALVDGISTGSPGGSSPPGIGADPREFEFQFSFFANDPCTGTIQIVGP